MQSKTVRWGSDGVGLEFVVFDAKDPRRGQSMLAGGADRQALEKFLEGFRAHNGTAVILSTPPPERIVILRCGGMA